MDKRFHIGIMLKPLLNSLYKIHVLLANMGAVRRAPMKGPVTSQDESMGEMILQKLQEKQVPAPPALREEIWLFFTYVYMCIHIRM